MTFPHNKSASWQIWTHSSMRSMRSFLLFGMLASIAGTSPNLIFYRKDQFCASMPSKGETV